MFRETDCHLIFPSSLEVSLVPPQSPALHPHMKCGVDGLWDWTLVSTRNVGPAQL